MLQFLLTAEDALNPHKLSITFSCTVHETLQANVCTILGVRRTMNHGIYLGVPSFIGRGKRKALEYIKDRVWPRLNNWSTQKLSRADKELLLKLWLNPYQIILCRFFFFLSVFVMN